MDKIPDDSEDLWIKNLIAEMAGQGISVEDELQSFYSWCEDKDVTPTRSRFSSWLDKAEKPMTYKRKRRPSDPLAEVDTNKPPSGNWRRLALAVCGEEYRSLLTDLDSDPWPALRPAYGRRIWLASLNEQKGLDGSGLL